jgi:predicted negative regulator of RcsB-dependent stress response
MTDMTYPKGYKPRPPANEKNHEDENEVQEEKDSRKTRIKKFFKNLAFNIVGGILIAVILLAVAWPGIGPLLTDFLPKHYPQYQNYWWIIMGVIGAIGLFFWWVFRKEDKTAEKTSYDENILSIMKDVNTNPHTDEEKKAIESMLKALNVKIHAETVGKVLNDLRQEHGKNFKVAFPYLERYLKEYIEFYLN